MRKVQFKKIVLMGIIAFTSIGVFSCSSDEENVRWYVDK